ncbi:hypothetical protein L3V82_00640 [Thiotrichales bacterium 19S3-7]|nr:hypothetical protein [Thiotrichales bacterium 19S3-7]MCF6800670.1 hypothetical protein [Thiotrichales bacterium 19S3-11]
MMKPMVILLLILLNFVIGNVYAVDKPTKVIDTEKKISFPRDLFAHNGFNREWWYFSGVITTKDKHPYAYNFTVFKTFNNYTTIFQMSDLITAKKLGYTEDTVVDNKDYSHSLNLKIGQSSLSYDQKNKTWHISINKPNYQFELALKPIRPYVLNGKNGYIDQSSGGKSAYYSAQNMDASGKLVIDGHSATVSGKGSWMDRQWGNFGESPAAFNYYWLSCRFDDNTGLMLYTFLDAKQDPISKYATGTYQDAQGKGYLVTDLLGPPINTFYKANNDSNYYNLEWLVRVPSKKLAFRIMPITGNQFVISKTQGSFWEGATQIYGAKAGYCFLEGSYGNELIKSRDS